MDPKAVAQRAERGVVAVEGLGVGAVESFGFKVVIALHGMEAAHRGHEEGGDTGRQFGRVGGREQSAEGQVTRCQRVVRSSDEPEQHGGPGHGRQSSESGAGMGGRWGAGARERRGRGRGVADVRGGRGGERGRGKTKRGGEGVGGKGVSGSMERAASARRWVAVSASAASSPVKYVDSAAWMVMPWVLRGVAGQRRLMRVMRALAWCSVTVAGSTSPAAVMKR